MLQSSTRKMSRVICCHLNNNLIVRSSSEFALKICWTLSVNVVDEPLSLIDSEAIDFQSFVAIAPMETTKRLNQSSSRRFSVAVACLEPQPKS